MSGTALAPRRVTKIKKRSYLHFDCPLTEAEQRVFDVTPSEVASWDFWPLLGFDRSLRKIDFDAESHWKITRKDRPIRYASHKDAAVFAVYAAALGARYEDFLVEQGLDKSVFAYRSGIGSNIEFAKDLFDEVRNRESCHVVCLDISKFFDMLDHDRLRARVNEIRGELATKDWQKVIKRVTRFEHADIKSVRAAVRRSAAPGRICSTVQFRSSVRPLIQINDKPYGIPQGTPLSGVLANVYLSRFDCLAMDYASSLGGSYRRYSDDIAFVLPTAENAEDLISAVEFAAGLEALRINPSKTTRTSFSKLGGLQEASLDPLQYLGFTFDGKQVLVRSSSLSRYYSRMKASVRIAVRAAAHKGYPAAEIRRRSLIGRFTHWGDSRNFVQYAYRASKIMDAPEIRGQLRRHVKLFDQHFQECVNTYYS